MGRGRNSSKTNMKKYISPNTQAIHCNFESHLMTASSPENITDDVVFEPEFSDKAGWDAEEWSEE